MAKASSAHLLKVVPLGGVGEVGKNCTLLQQGSDMVLIDGGVKFPEDELLGIDLVIPDVSYVREHIDQLRAIVITHGHEDHIGALAYIVTELNATAPIPLYGSALALGLARNKLEERHAMHRVTPHEVKPGDSLMLGQLDLEFISVGHSIPDAMAVAIHSAVGTVIYTGDWKFADMPQEGLQRLRDLGDIGVLALLADCVRIESPGRTPPESVVTDAIGQIMATAPGRVIVTTFASNIFRVGAVIRLAHTYGRVCALVGRSMERNITVAQELGYLDVPAGTLVTVEQTRRFAAREVVLVTTGSQGEPNAALSRIAAGDHRQIRIVPDDTVVIAATPVPGNEESVSQTIDNLFRAGANVAYPRTHPNIHVSGHAGREEHIELLDIVRPRFAVPFHGEYRMMVLYQKMAVEWGLGRDSVLLPNLGDVIEFRADSARLHGTVPAGAVLVDGVTVGAVTQVVLRDRKRLAADGILVAAVPVERHTGHSAGTAEILLRGMPHQLDNELIDGVRQKIERVLQRHHQGEVERRLLSDLIRESVGQYIVQQTGLRPMILPLILDV